MTVAGRPEALTVSLKARATVPAYILRGYEVRAVAYGFGEVPIERVSAKLPDIAPGQDIRVPFALKEKGISRIRVDLLRPTGFSACTEIWRY